MFLTQIILKPQNFKIRPCKTRLGASTFFSCIPFTLSYININSLLEHANMPPTDRVMDASCIETLFGLKKYTKDTSELVSFTFFLI